MSYDPKDTMFEFMWKEPLTSEDREMVRIISHLPLIVHPDVLDKINEILGRKARVLRA